MSSQPKGSTMGQTPTARKCRADRRPFCDSWISRPSTLEGLARQLLPPGLLLGGELPQDLLPGALEDVLELLARLHEGLLGLRHHLEGFLKVEATRRVPGKIGHQLE